MLITSGAWFAVIFLSAWHGCEVTVSEPLASYQLVVARGSLNQGPGFTCASRIPG